MTHPRLGDLESMQIAAEIANRMSANRLKAAVRLIWAKLVAIDPEWTYVGRPAGRLAINSFTINPQVRKFGSL